MLHLHRYKILSLCALLALAAQAVAQTRGTYNYLDFANKPYYFGITLAYNSSDYRLFHSQQFAGQDSILSAESITGPGFNLGIVTNLKLGKDFDLRLLPTLSFVERRFVYSNESSPLPYERRIESVFVELPFHVRYKSRPYNDMRFFVLAGVKYAFDVASDSRSRQAEELLKISPTDFQLEYGGGIQFFFPYFIFSPEIKVSHGVNNVLLYNDNLQESTILEKILSRTFTLSFHFEG